VSAIRLAGVPWYRQASKLCAEGGDRLEALSFDSRGKTLRIETPVLMLHQGVIPSTHVSAAAGCELDWNEQQQCWQPRLDDWGESSRPGVFVAGSAAGIGGARAAWLGGQLAGLQVAHQLGLLELGGAGPAGGAEFGARAPGTSPFVLSSIAIISPRRAH